MKSVIMSCSKLLFLSVWVLAGCSSTVFHPVVSQQTPVSRDNALIVMGVTWVEIYNDTEDALDKKQYSADLLKNEKSVRKLLVDEKGTALNGALYYLSRFQFHFENPAEEEHGFIRFDRDVREYEEIAIHEFSPGLVQLVNIEIEQRHYNEDGQIGDVDYRWKKHRIEYKKDYGSWDLQAGRVSYLGHLRMYFKTRRFVFGLLTPEELVKQTQLVAIVIEDRFDEVKQRLKNKKPWFPVAEMVNQARPAKWIFLQDAFAEFQQGAGLETGKKKIIKRNKKKFFF
ncbi:MAG: hypothetical protein HOK67_14290 [Deltaproteobacteria bacterium]|jgi:hypothetical protein|nr:hypothetical protein [Deltaproteobacteria bacterium]MBT4638014.1 hypothetical protein [Deltaproteobacteria bacterium]MBT6501064.1 hypothetical protein [Deltaproteobacteria bacterium]MBT7155957.1 hypothetical protein [Deltaproteobacteria bacterium]MBT7715440.1 hypothetical protein [Deltaproteobacteria bacterium]